MEIHSVQLFAPISIHALLAESDLVLSKNLGVHDISIHALLAESDERWYSSMTYQQHFYPRSPCGERLFAEHRATREKDISIHALLAESDLNRHNVIKIMR